MIVRIFQASVHSDKTAAFGQFFTETAMPLVRRQPGLVSMSAGLPRPESPTEFAMVMIWEDVASIRAFAGEKWREPHIDQGEAALVRDRRLSHYELAPGLVS